MLRRFENNRQLVIKILMHELYSKVFNQQIQRQDIRFVEKASVCALKTALFIRLAYFSFFTSFAYCIFLFFSLDPPRPKGLHCSKCVCHRVSGYVLRSSTVPSVPSRLVSF